MIKKTVPVIEDIWLAYTQGFQGVAWCESLRCLVEVEPDGGWEPLSPHDYSKYVDWSENEDV